jgi:hypothetical protein
MKRGKLPLAELGQRDTACYAAGAVRLPQGRLSVSAGLSPGGVHVLAGSGDVVARLFAEVRAGVHARFIPIGHRPLWTVVAILGRAPPTVRFGETGLLGH